MDVDMETLDTDVAFTAPAPSTVINEKDLGQGSVDASRKTPVRPAFVLPLLAPALLALRNRRRRGR